MFFVTNALEWHQDSTVIIKSDEFKHLSTRREDVQTNSEHETATAKLSSYFPSGDTYIVHLDMAV